MDATVRDLVRHRASNRCAYGLLTQEQLPFATFHVEHIMPRQHGGDDAPAHLALAGDRCHAHTGPNLTGLDPETGALVPLFDPRAHAWDEHFCLSDVTIIGLTALGRTTVRVLKMHEARRVRLRAVLKRYGQR